MIRRGTVVPLAVVVAMVIMMVVVMSGVVVATAAAIVWARIIGTGVSTVSISRWITRVASHEQAAGSTQAQK